MIALLAAGAAALAGWAFRALRVDEPIIDIRALSRPILLTLLALVLAAGSFRSMLQLTGIVAQVPPDLGLGYGLGDGEAVAVLLAAPNLGIVIGGICAGWIAGRFGPALPLLGGIAVGTVATFAMLAGVSVLPLAIACGAMLGVAAGAIGASGYNLATRLVAPERQGTVAGLVSVVLALGSVVFNFAGGEVLKATHVPGTSADGAPVSTATGVYLYVAMAGCSSSSLRCPRSCWPATGPPHRSFPGPGFRGRPWRTGSSRPCPPRLGNVVNGCGTAGRGRSAEDERELRGQLAQFGLLRVGRGAPSGADQQRVRVGERRGERGARRSSPASRGTGRGPRRAARPRPGRCAIRSRWCSVHSRTYAER